MGVLIDKAIETYNYLNYDLQDPRGVDYFYINTPWFWLILDICYINFVTKWGPNWMKDRQPFQLDGIIRIYNIAQIVCNTYVFLKALGVVLDERYDWICMPLINDGSEYANQIYNVGIFIFWLKISDLLDTVFFVLRKKAVQVSFLHVYHHAIMVFALWFGLKYAPGGNPIVLVLLNSFVHVVMYSYYLLSSIDQEYKKSIWWKKHLTQLQILQFFMITVHMSFILYDNYCGYPYGLAVLLVTQTLFITVMFFDFYIKTYIKKKKTA